MSGRVAPEKVEVVACFREEVAAALRTLAQVTGDARDEATSGQSKAENKYDTRATEASYLAAGQGERLLSLRSLAAWLEHFDPSVPFRVAGLGALVCVEREGLETWLLLGPQGGQPVVVRGVSVLLVSMDAPLGAALRGRELDDVAEVETPAGPQVLEVVRIR